MRRTGSASIALVLCIAAIIATPLAEHKVLASTALATTSIVLQEGHRDYDGTTDVYIDRWTPDRNWGGSDWLMVTKSNDRAGLIRFELADHVPQGSTVTAATLELYTANRNRVLSEPIGAYRVLCRWVETEATWNRPMLGQWWGEAGCNSSADRELEPVDTLTVSNVGEWYRFNVTGLVQAWVNDPASNLGLLIKGIDRCLPIEYMFYTSESGMRGYRPILRVEYGAGAPPTPGVCTLGFNPAHKVASPTGGAFTLDVELQRVRDLGGFEFSFAFNPAVVRVDEIALGSFVTGAGRAFTALRPRIDNDMGAASFGAYSYGAEPGRGGSGPIARITFTPVAVGRSALRFSSAQVSTTSGTAIPTTTEGGSIEVRLGLTGDVDGDCDVDIIDIMLVAGRWGATRGSARYDERCDLDGDGDIDLADIMQVVEHYGQHC